MGQRDTSTAERVLFWLCRRLVRLELDVCARDERRAANSMAELRAVRVSNTVGSLPSTQSADVTVLLQPHPQPLPQPHPQHPAETDSGTTAAPTPVPPPSVANEAQDARIADFNDVARCREELAALGGDAVAVDVTVWLADWNACQWCLCVLCVAGLIMLGCFWPVDERNTSTWTLLCASRGTRAEFLGKSRCDTLSEAFFLFVPEHADYSGEITQYSSCSSTCVDNIGRTSWDVCDSFEGGSTVWVYKSSLSHLDETTVTCGIGDPHEIFLGVRVALGVLAWLSIAVFLRIAWLRRWMRLYTLADEKLAQTLRAIALREQ